MSYRVKLTNAAKKQFDKLPETQQGLIIYEFRNLCDYYEDKSASNPDIRALQGKYKGFYRLKAGDYRIIFNCKHEELVIAVIKISHRKNVYR